MKTAPGKFVNKPKKKTVHESIGLSYAVPSVVHRIFLELMAPSVAGRSSTIRCVLPNDITFNVRFLEIFCKKHLTKSVFDGRLTSTT